MQVSKKREKQVSFSSLFYTARAACFGARAAGQGVATAHVSQHTFGAAYYALKAVAASDAVNTEAKIAEESNWITQKVPINLRQEFLARITIQKHGDQFFIKLQKGKDF